MNQTVERPSEADPSNDTPRDQSTAAPARDWRLIATAVVAALALVVGVYALAGGFAPRPAPVLAGAGGTTSDTGGTGTSDGGTAADQAPTADQVATTPLTNAVGHYRLQVPEGMRAQRSGRTTKLIAGDRSLVVTVVPVPRIDPALGNARVLAAMESSYRSVRTIGHESEQVAGHRAVTTFGTAVTKPGVRVQFVLVSVFGARTSYAISTFAAADADPATLLPRVRAVLDGFRAA